VLWDRPLGVSSDLRSRPWSEIEQRRLPIVPGREASARSLLRRLTRGGPRSARGSSLRHLPSLLVSDALPLLDHEEIDEARQRIAQEAEVTLPVARGERQRPHLIECDGQRRPIPFARCDAELAQYLARRDARRRGAGHGGRMLTRSSISAEMDLVF